LKERIIKKRGMKGKRHKKTDILKESNFSKFQQYLLLTFYMHLCPFTRCDKVGTWSKNYFPHFSRTSDILTQILRHSNSLLTIFRDSN
jgi:hypothetical protein